MVATSVELVEFICVGKLCEPVNVCEVVGFNRAYANKLLFTNAVVATVLSLVPVGCVVVVMYLWPFWLSFLSSHPIVV